MVRDYFQCKAAGIDWVVVATTRYLGMVVTLRNSDKPVILQVAGLVSRQYVETIIGEIECFDSCSPSTSR